MCFYKIHIADYIPHLTIKINFIKGSNITTFKCWILKLYKVYEVKRATQKNKKKWLGTLENRRQSLYLYKRREKISSTISWFERSWIRFTKEND